jgi:hypothetical protein
MSDWRAEMQGVKNSAYAWRQMIFYLSLIDDGEVFRFADWAEEYLANQREEFRLRFAPAMSGVQMVLSGGRFDRNGVDLGTGGRRFLGWTLGRHWLLPDRDDQASRI